MIPLGHEDVGRLDVAMDDAFGVSRVQRVGDLDGQSQKQANFQRLRVMRCFRVVPSRNSMAMKDWARACRFRKSCKCWDGSGPRPLGLRGGSAPRSAHPGQLLQAGTQGDEAAQLVSSALYTTPIPPPPRLLGNPVVERVCPIMRTAILGCVKAQSICNWTYVLRALWRHLSGPTVLNPRHKTRLGKLKSRSIHRVSNWRAI